MCNGFIPRIYVSYPILAFTQMECDEQERRSPCMIVIDDFSANNTFIEKLREKAPIKVTKSGWSYGQENHKENFCIQQTFWELQDERSTHTDRKPIGC